MIYDFSKLKRTNTSFSGVRVSPRAKGARLSIRISGDLAIAWGGVERVNIIYDDQSRMMTIKSDKSGPMRWNKKENGIEIKHHDFLPAVKKAMTVKPDRSGNGFVEFKMPKSGF